MLHTDIERLSRSLYSKANLRGEWNCLKNSEFIIVILGYRGDIAAIEKKDLIRLCLDRSWGRRSYLSAVEVKYPNKGIL
jgi:hypothetical protein